MKDRDYYLALSKDEVTQAVARNFKTSDVTVLEYQLLSISDKPLGFMGVHFKIRGTAKVQGKEEVFQYFAKKIPEDVPTHNQYATDIGAFFKEIQFFETVVEDTKNNLTGKHKKWCPELYFSRADEIVVFEDLTPQGYYMYPERTLLELDYVMATVRAMAAMHAASLLLQAKLAVGSAPCPPPNWGPAHPPDLALLYSHILYETEASDILGHFGNTFYRAGISSQVHIVDLLPGYSPEQRENIKKHLPGVLLRILTLVKPSDKYRNTWIHGDLWANNTMFLDDENHRVKDAIIIDFQIARFAPPAHDLAMFIHLVQNRAFREAHETQVLDYYYDTFTEEVTNEGFEVEEILPKTELLESYKYYYEFAISSKVLFYQLVLSPPHITSKFLQTPELFDRNFLVDRSEMLLETYRTDELCRSRMTEGMQEIIEFHHLDDVERWKDVQV